MTSVINLTNDLALLRSIRKNLKKRFRQKQLASFTLLVLKVWEVLTAKVSKFIVYKFYIFTKFYGPLD